MAGRNRKRSQQFNLNLVRNTVQFQYYFNKLWNLALSRFTWAVPDSIDEQFLERNLQTRGSMIGFVDAGIGPLILPYTAYGPLNLYNIPIKRQAYANNGYRQNLTQKNSITLFNNYTRTGDVQTLELFAARLANLDITIDININAQKTPVIIEADENTRQTMLNVYMQYDGNFHYIFPEKELNLTDNVKVLNVNAPFVSKELQQLKNDIFNEFLAFEGIPSAPQKRERVNAGEVGAMNGNVYASRMSPLICRKDFCSRMNKMFGTEFDVGFQYLETDSLEMYRSDVTENIITEESSNEQ